jgi:TetR/AcrR family transcriptional repressor of nem operon
VTRTKPAQQRRADLLAASKALFLAKGIAATSLDDITSSAGVSKGLFYLYFRSKEHLVLALQDEFAAEFAEQVRSGAAAQSDWGAKLDACVQAGFEYYRDRHDMHEILFHHAAHGAHGPHLDKSAHNLASEAIREVLVAGVAAGAFEVADPEAAALVCYASMHAFDPEFRGQAELPDDRLIAAARRLFRCVAGLGPEVHRSVK